MLSLKFKDQKYRKKFALVEKKKRLLKFTFTFLVNYFKALNNKKALNFKIIFLLLKYNFFKKYKNSKTKIHARCIFTNRNKIPYRTLNVGRVHLRKMLSYGIIPGYHKAVW